MSVQYLRFFLCVLLLIAATNSVGQLSQNLTIGNPKALALGHAVTADPPGIDSIHFNPAGLIRLKGKQLAVKFTSGHATQRVTFNDTMISDQQKIALCAITEGCNIDEGDWESIWPVDPVANTESSTTGNALYLPGKGIENPDVLLVPTGGFSISDHHNRLTFATAVYSPMASGYQRDENDPATFHGIEGAVTRITYVSPSLALRVSDTVSVGASLGFSYQGIGLSTNFRGAESTFAYMQEFASDVALIDSDLLRFIGPYDTMGRLEMDMEDNLSTHINLGVLWEPAPWLSVGVVYQSEATATLSGQWRMDYSSEVGEMISSMVPFNSLIQAAVGAQFTGPDNPEACLADTANGGTSSHCEYSQRGELDSEFTLPAHVAIGMSIRLVPDLKVNIDLKWTQYSTWDIIETQFDKDADFLLLADMIYFIRPDEQFNPSADTLILPRNYEDSLTWALGLEYTYSDQWLLRCGLEPRGGAVPHNKVDLGAPYVNGYLYGIGFGYTPNSDTVIDVALGWWNSSFHADYGESDNSNSNEAGRIIYNPYASQSYESHADAYVINLQITKQL